MTRTNTVLAALAVALLLSGTGLAHAAMDCFLDIESDVAGKKYTRHQVGLVKLAHNIAGLPSGDILVRQGLAAVKKMGGSSGKGTILIVKRIDKTSPSLAASGLPTGKRQVRLSLSSPDRRSISIILNDCAMKARQSGRPLPGTVPTETFTLNYEDASWKMILLR